MNLEFQLTKTFLLKAIMWRLYSVLLSFEEYQSGAHSICGVDGTDPPFDETLGVPFYAQLFFGRGKLNYFFC